MATTTGTTQDTSNREILITRLINAPRELVFEAFTSPEHVIHWYGPDGFTITNKEMDVKPGGVWRFIMHGPDGTDYPNKIVFIEVVKPERLVYQHSDDDGNLEPIRFHVTVTFEKQGNKTDLTMRSVFETPEERDRVVKEYGAIEGGIQTLNRLQEYLTKMQ